MGTKYSSVTVTSYNASPPADDGSQSASNQITWAKHKTKLGDPLKTAVEAVNTALVAALNTEAVAKADTYTVTAAEHAKTIEVTTASAGVDIILLDAATAAAGFFTEITNAPNSTNNLRVKLTTSTDFLQTVTDGTILMPPDSSMVFKVNSGANGYIATNGRNLVLNKTVAVAIDTVSVGAGTLRTLTIQDKDYTVADDADINLTTLTTDGAPNLNADFIRTYDADAAAYKKVLLGQAGGGILMTEETTTGVAVDFLGIPSWATEIMVLMDGISSSGSSIPIIQVGPSGTPVTTGYSSSSGLSRTGTTGSSNFSNGIGLNAGTHAAVDIFSGMVTFVLMDSANNQWVASGTIGYDNQARVVHTAGSISLAGELNIVRLTTANGTDTIDAGSINVRYR